MSMDEFYDTAGAGKTLEKISTERMTALVEMKEEAIQHLAEIDIDSIVVVETGHSRKTWRLCSREDEHGISDEIVFRVQGVITKNNLIPKNVISCPQKKVLFITQQADICGLDSAVFKTAMAKLEEINDRFEEHFCGQTVVKLTRPFSSVGPTFTASNRLFTSKNDAPTEQDNPFLFGVDPLGALAKAKGNDLIHAPENMVRYFKWQKPDESKGSSKYIETVPGAFKSGDLVEMQISFVAILGKHKDIRITSRLQAITLLDNGFTRAATVARNAHKAIPVVQKAVRRKVGYMYDENADESGRHAKKRAVVMDRMVD
ncbi:hypothetical protein C8R43DRAFT_1138248 [Mycena crocata]|nr:hypothetical protein C8R43DRAFT_1138248 [Mycena crocata]